uniref:SSD domain-containing protein n=1 Tax=Parascaris equorum TaxID=6256 RepID=A0A914S8B1_PAREQ
MNEVICPAMMPMLTTFVTGCGMVFADTLCFLQLAYIEPFFAPMLASFVFFTSGPEMSRLPSEIISSSRRTSKTSRNGENLCDKCLLSTSSFEQSSCFPILEQYDDQLLRCSQTGIHSKRPSGQLYHGDMRLSSSFDNKYVMVLGDTIHPIKFVYLTDNPISGGISFTLPYILMTSKNSCKFC